MDCLTSNTELSFPALMKRAELELGETPARRAKALTELKDLIKEIPNLDPLIDDVFLLGFLRVRKFDVQRALTTLLKFYKFNKEYSRIYTNFLPSEMQRILDMNVLTVLPKRHPGGALIGYCKCDNLNLEVGTMTEVVALGIIITEIYLLQETVQVCGVYLVIDFKGCSFQQVLHILSMKFLTTLFRYLQECWPCRLKGLHIIYEPLAVHYAYRIIKFFLSKKMKERFFMHGSDMISLHKHIPRDTLPQDCGGTGEHANEDEFRTLILNHQSYIQKLNQYGFKINSVHT